MDTIAFHISTGKELSAVKDRVRNLVDHWPEDGRYKEVILKSMIQRFLPEKFNICSGFVVRKTDNRAEHESSNQIDLIIYDRSYPVLFKEGDFAIVTPDSVSAIIEVKANIANAVTSDVIERANENGLFIYEGRQGIAQEKQIFNGIFSYDGNETTAPRTLRTHIANGNINYNNHHHRNLFKVNHICYNNDRFYKLWSSDPRPNVIYNVNDLAPSFFIGNLMHFLSGSSVMDNSNLWFPMDKTVRELIRF